jgi:serine/threonine protein kinase, bacterial
VRPVGSRYLLEEPLGRGATGTVWRARVRESGQPEAEEGTAARRGETVAIKVLREELASDPDVVMRFLRERSVLLRLTHPNIVRVRDLVVEGDLLALVMDLVDGPDLHRYLRANGPFSPVAASLLTAQIADALAASHADEIVHRDLKPANVLLVTGEGEGGSVMHPLLTDFGIARLADSPGITRTSEFVGTPAYVAPESAEGLPQTSAVDVYGAGILLYELVTGRPPFEGDGPLAVLHRHLSEEPRRPGNVPDPLWTVIERCLRKSPQERPSARNLARALRAVADGIGVHASPDQVEAAFGVGALLAPDPSPTAVPGGGGTALTQVLPHGSAGPDAEPTRVLPANGPGGQADPTRVLPSGPGDGQPQGPHPWQTQMRAARDRNEQTQIQPLDPGEDPLRRRPRRQAPQQPPAQPYQQPHHQPYQQPYQQQGAPYAPPPAAPRRPEPAPPEPRPRREPRPRSRTRIPGMGCLKGCLTVVVILVVIAWLAWTFTPLQDWIADGKSFWQASHDWIEEAWKWLGKIPEKSS